MGGFSSEESGFARHVLRQQRLRLGHSSPYPGDGRFSQVVRRDRYPNRWNRADQNHFDPELDRNLAGIGACWRLISSSAGGRSVILGRVDAAPREHIAGLTPYEWRQWPAKWPPPQVC